MAEAKVRLFVAGSCGPCKQVKDRIRKGKVNIQNIEMVDVEDKKNLHWIDDMGLKKVPSAFQGDKECTLSFKGDGLVIDCKA